MDLWLTLLLLAAVVLVLLFQGAALLLARRMPSVGPEVADRLRGAPRLSVIIAARNEETDLGGCLDDLLAQDFRPEEILVVDGGSTDRTREVALARGPRVRLIEEPPLPSGWVGKNWACRLGAQAASGEYLLFTDADMRYSPRAVSSALAWAQEENADLTSLTPRIEMVGFWERVVLPFTVQMILTYFRASSVNRDSSHAAMANGQFYIVRRTAYDAVGGHDRIRGVVLEDVQLAREFRAAGLRSRLGWAPELLSTRMYRDRREMFEGLLKNAHDTHFSAARQIGFIVGLVGLFWLPLCLLPAGILWHSALWSVLGGVLWIALFGKHAIFAHAIRGRAVDGLLFPVAVGFYVVLMATSLVNGLRRRPLAWKGRAYSIQAR
jgi:chlorobactene glucosyltransferase